MSGAGSVNVNGNGGRALRRVLVVLPSWVGDAVMATPALREIRRGLPGSLVGALARPGIDQVLAGSGLIDEFHVDRAGGVMGPKHAAAALRAMRYDAALLLSNSFRTALVTRLAFIPRRVGYDRDGRGLLLTDRIRPEQRAGGSGWAVVPAPAYYVRAARMLLRGDAMPVAIGDVGKYELATSAEQESAADRVLGSVGFGSGFDVHGAAAARADAGGAVDANVVATPFAMAVLNPGGNNPAKRWPAERFGALAAWLVRERGMRVAVNGSPGEAEVVDAVVRTAHESIGDSSLAGRVVSLASAGGTIGSLLGVVRRASLMVSNDTGPRHMALAFGVPTVSLFGPTDHRWTTPPMGSDVERRLLSCEDLEDGVLADDVPERCVIDRISLDAVCSACVDVLREHGRDRAGSGV